MKNVKIDRIYFLIDFIIPILTATVAIGYFLSVFPSIQSALLISSEATGTNLAPIGNAIRIAGVFLYFGFSVKRVLLAYHQYQSRMNLLEATEIGSKQLTEAREMLEEILQILRPRRRRT